VRPLSPLIVPYARPDRAPSSYMTCYMGQQSQSFYTSYKEKILSHSQQPPKRVDLKTAHFPVNIISSIGAKLP